MRLPKLNREAIEIEWFRRSYTTKGEYKGVMLCNFFNNTQLSKYFDNFWQFIKCSDNQLLVDNFFHYDFYDYACREEKLILRAMVLIMFLDSLEE